MKKLLAMIVIISAATALADEKTTPHRLFHIERNKNANIVVYDALVLPDGILREKDPVEVYWLKLAEGGDRKKLKGIEKRMAYGFKVEERQGNRLQLKMKADIGRPVMVDTLGGAYRAFMDIDGRPAIVEKVYIYAEETGLLPSVKYLELFGHDRETGEEAYEKYIP